MGSIRYRSNLRTLMSELKIRTLTEVAYLADVSKKDLMKIESGEINRVNHKVIKKLEEFFNCETRGIYEVLADKPDSLASVRNELSFSRQYTGVVYFIRNESTRLVKIGFTGDLKQRVLGLKYEHKAEMTLLHFISSMDCFVLERVIHSFFAEKRVNGEWFDLTLGEIMRINADPPKRQ